MHDRSAATRFGIASAGVVVAIAVRLALDPLLGSRFPFFTLVLAVLFTAWYVDFVAALVAIGVGAVGAMWFLLEPRHQLWADREGLAGLSLYFAVSVSIAVFGRAMQRAREAAETQAATAATQREQLRVTLQSIGDAVITTDVDGRITSMNAVAATLTGWTVEDAVGQALETIFHIIDEATRGPAPNPVRAALARGNPVGMANHTLLITRDGRELPIDDSAAPIRDDEGVTTGVVLVFRDNSHRREVERSQALLANVVEQSEDAIVTKTLSGIVTSWNRGAERVFGYRSDEMVGQSILRLIPPEQTHEETSILAAIARGERVEHFESERVCKDGRRITVSLSISPIREPSGDIIGASKIARDITERDRAERGRQQALRELTTLYAVGQTVAAELDRERVLQTITDAATDLSGARFGAFFYNVVGVEGASYLLFTLSGAPRDAFERFGMPRNTAVFAPTFSGDGVVRVADIRQDPRYGHNAPHFGTPAGHLPVVSYLAVPVVSRSGEVFGGLFLGHPEPGVFSAEAERIVVALAAQASIALDNAMLFESAQRARDVAEQASQEKDHFLAMLGHELRNPLSAVRNALTASQLDPARTPRALAIAAHAAEHLNRLVDDLLDVTRVTQGRLVLRKRTFDLTELVPRAVESLRPLFDEQGVSVALDLPAGACLMNGDPLRIEQVVVNLLTNAAKYSHPGGRVAVSAGCRGGAAVLRVVDAGIGIGPELLPRVFDLFVQGAQALDRARGGLGIGLTLVRKLVDLHGGQVEARSAGVGQGAEFIVTLPIGDALPVSEVPRPSAPVRDDIQVLIVEDNTDAAESLTMLLEVMGLAVRAVIDGPAALAAARAAPPDVMLVDIGLPGMSGYELARQVRADARLRDILLVALTGYGQDEDRQRALAAGFDHHLTKPVEMDRVRELMATLSPGSARGPQRTAEG